MKRLAVIGCGLRSDSYLHELREGLGREWQLCALADPNSTALEVYLTNYGDSAVRTFSTGPELLAAMGDQLDAVIIGSPNTLHLESLVPALRKKLTVVLEKPVATTIKDCRTMWQVYQEAGRPPLAVGFVLRYTAYFTAIKRIIDRGDIGQILTIEASEALAPDLTSVFTRTWRRLDRLTGSFILEKCCHDMDILNWLAQACASRVSSFATRTRFIPNPEAAMHCCDCRFKDSCRYSVSNIAPYLINTSRLCELERLIPADNDLCVFNSDKDVPDHQVINVEFENGILATFTACMDQPKTTRTLKINGTNGQIVGDIGEDYLEVRHQSKNKEFCDHEKTPIRIEHDSSGHHGGDSILSNQIKAMLRGQPIPPLAGLKEGIEACLLAMAAEESRHAHQIVEMKDIRSKVFQCSNSNRPQCNTCIEQQL